MSETTPIGTIKKMNINGIDIEAIKITESEWIVPYAFEKCGLTTQRNPHLFFTDLS